MWFSDMFRVTGAEVNPLANTLVRRVEPDFGVLLRGPVLIIGTNIDGSDTDVPDELLRDAKTLVSP